MQRASSRSLMPAAPPNVHAGGDVRVWAECKPWSPVRDASFVATGLVNTKVLRERDREVVVCRRGN